MMKFVDGGEVDDKIICVPADDRNNGDCYYIFISSDFPISMRLTFQLLPARITI